MSRYLSPAMRKALPLTVAGTIALLYSLINMKWQHMETYWAVFPLLIIIEWFPVRIGKVQFTFVFPLLYMIALITGFEAAALTSAGMIAMVSLVKRRPLRAILFNATSRLIALLVCDVLIHLLHWTFLPASLSISYLLIHLIITLLVFTGVSNWLLKLYYSIYSAQPHSRRSLMRITLWYVGSSFLYTSLMVVLALDPNQAASGPLGTFYFFLPWTGAMIVAYLFTNLSRAKSGLETLFSVARSINQQLDLPAVLEQVVQEARRLVLGNSAQLYLVQDDGTLHRVVSTSASYTLSRLPMQVGLVGRVAETGEPLLVHDVERDTRYLLGEAEAETRTLLLVPIHIEDRVAGVISIGKNETFLFQEDDLKMITIFASHAAVAMKNALYLEEREKRLLVEERNRLAREMHDGIGQELASAILQVEMIKRQEPQQVQLSLAQLEESLRQTATAVRQAIYSLRPQPYSHIGLVPAMRAELEEVEAEDGLQTRLTVEVEEELFTPEMARAVFQIFTEGLQNVIKHAQAQSLWVVLSRDEHHLRMTIRDDGIGFHFGQAILQAAERKSFGIENLHHIAEGINGSLDYITAPGEGTEIVLEIPLEEEEWPHDDPSLAL
ncbi:MAG TPA: GAF domain-containing sensor histidine kinase [Bacilli bacterium]|nr:GAF domain-containing sensor histidine kinase [Bacilli bacterium]